MRILRIWLIFNLIMLACILDVAAAPKIEFWNQPRKGANFFNQSPQRGRFEAGRKLGLQFVRLAPDKWTSTDRDFLIGNADKYEAINEKDFDRLKQVLDDAEQIGVKVVLTMLSLPGARWKQNNHGQDDPRLWQHEQYQQQAINFWQELARRLKDHPAVVAYDPLNEPHPARALLNIDDVASVDFSAWFQSATGTVADLNRFNRRMVVAIRQVDPATPVVLETYAYSSADGFRFLAPSADDTVLYSFHFYEPWNYTTKRINNGRFTYPDQMPTGWSGTVEKWTPDHLQQIVQPVVDWSERYDIPTNRILVGEFGCNREVAGAQSYLADLVQTFNQQQWHWASYAYREDTWTGIDYELGAGRLGWKYWQAIEVGEQPEKLRGDNPLFDVLKREFR